MLAREPLIVFGTVAGAMGPGLMCILTKAGRSAAFPAFLDPAQDSCVVVPVSWECWNLERPVAGALPGGADFRDVDIALGELGKAGGPHGRVPTPCGSFS